MGASEAKVEGVGEPGLPPEPEPVSAPGEPAPPGPPNPVPESEPDIPRGGLSNPQFISPGPAPPLPGEGEPRQP
jgi:hypothetical protein